MAAFWLERKPDKVRAALTILEDILAYKQALLGEDHYVSRL